jgi:hypothetical protein
MGSRISAGCGALIANLTLSACASLGEQASDIIFVPHADSAKVDGEATTLTLFFKRPEEAQQELAAAAVAAPVLIGMALDGVQQMLADEKERYIGAYSATATVYSEAGKPVFPTGFLFERKVKIDGTLQPAMRFCGDFQKLGETLFVIRPYATDLLKSRAKVVAFDATSPFGFDVLNPWELVTDWFGDGPRIPPVDDDVDMIIDMSFSGLRYDEKSGERKVVALGRRSFERKDIKIGKKKTPPPGEEGSPTCDGFKGRTEREMEGIKDGPQLNFNAVMAAPKPISDAPGEPTIFNVVITATESDAFAKRVEQLSDRFSSERPGLEGRLNEIMPK